MASAVIRVSHGSVGSLPCSPAATQDQSSISPMGEVCTGLGMLSTAGEGLRGGPFVSSLALLTGGLCSSKEGCSPAPLAAYSRVMPQTFVVPPAAAQGQAGQQHLQDRGMAVSPSWLVLLWLLRVNHSSSDKASPWCAEAGGSLGAGIWQCGAALSLPLPGKCCILLRGAAGKVSTAPGMLLLPVLVALAQLGHM